MKSTEQVAHQRERQRRYRQQNAEHRAYQKFVWREENQQHVADYQRAYRLKNPDYNKNRAAWDKTKQIEWTRRRDRRRAIANVKDKPAQERRIVAAAEAAAPYNLPDHVRSGVVAMLIERVYTGDLPIKLTSEHGKAALADYRRDVERFSLQHVSLDAPIGSDGTGTFHDITSKGLWE